MCLVVDRESKQQAFPKWLTKRSRKRASPEKEKFFLLRNLDESGAAKLGRV